MGRLHTFVVNLRRETRDTNWGLRLVGGADLATPLIVTRVTPGTPAGRELARGDIIAKIDHYDARDLRHEDAQNLFKNAPNQIKLVVQRSSPNSHLLPMPHSPGSYGLYGRLPTPSFYRTYESSRCSHLLPMPHSPGSYGHYGRVPTPAFYRSYSYESSPSSHLLPMPHSPGSYGLYGRVPTPALYRSHEEEDREAPRHKLGPRSPGVNAVPPPFRTASPNPTWRGPESLPRSTPVPTQGYLPVQSQTHFPVMQEGEYRTLLISPNSNRTDETVDESIQSQPYRTTPLVLPGAKVRREPGPTESYLRHHPNPVMRAPPHHDYRDTLMKQKVVHKQFNSPINLYSEQNIANSIRQQTSPLPSNGYYGRPNVVKRGLKPTLQYDPAKSETYRALQEEALGDDVQEVPTPVQPKVFTAPTTKKPIPVPKPVENQQQPKGKQTTFVNALHDEQIQQSNSFKRLMYHVLGDTEF